MKQYMKLLDVMKDGRRVTVAEIDATLTPTGFLMKRLSSYIWDIGHYAKGDVKAEKNGRKVIAYTLTNPEKFKNFKLDAPKVKAEGTPEMKAKTTNKTIVVKPVVAKGAGDVVKPEVAKAAAAKKKAAPKAKAKKAAKPTKVAKPKKAEKPVAKAKEVAEKIAKVSPPAVVAAPVKKAAVVRVKPIADVPAVEKDFDNLELPDFLARRPDGVKLAEEVE